MGNDLLTGFLAGQSDNDGNNGNGGGFFGNEGLWAVIILSSPARGTWVEMF